MNEQPDSAENLIRVLLLENNQADRQAFERLIAKNKLPYQLEIATTCAEALERIRQSTYDITLLDHNLDDGTGLDILPKLEGTPAIIVTGSGDEETAVLAMKQGAEDYLIKDLNRNYLKLLPHIIQGVLKRKQVDRTISQLNHQNELILNSAGEGIYGLNQIGKMIFMNPAAERKLGFDADELVKLSPDQLHTLLHHNKSDGSTHIRATCPIFATYRDGIAHRENDDVFWRKDGKPFPVDYSSTPIKEEGKIVGAVVVFRGIAERKQAEKKLREFSEKLQRSNEELQSFASVASHDLQEPLHKVIAFGDLLKHHYGSSLGEKGNGYIKRMGDASQRMKQLIEDLLQFSRITTKTQPFQSVDLSKVVREILIDLEVRISETHGRIDVSHLPTIEADPLQMRQLFQNLIGNALKFSREGVAPVIHLNSRQLDNEFWEITVEDNGIGFNENYLGKIFKPFERLHGRAKYKGSGIGLAICHKIVSRHGGTLTARSAEQKGATFIIMLSEKQTQPKG